MSLVSQWMVKEVRTVSSKQTVLEACLLMKQHQVGCVVVVDDQKPVGILTKGDVVTRVAAAGLDAAKTLVEAVMSRELTVDIPGARCDQAGQKMKEKGIRHLPVVENGTLAGILSMRDLEKLNAQVANKMIADLNTELSLMKGILEELDEERAKFFHVTTQEPEARIIRDSLTELYNYRFFQKTIVSEIEWAKKFNYALSLLFIDIDYFKDYNDKNGPMAGNVLLKQLADLLRRTSRTTRFANLSQAFVRNDILTRYGGGEFAIILPETRKKGAFIKAGRILEDVRNFPFEYRETQPGGRVTVSIGIAEFPADGDDWDVVVRKAGEMLSQAKSGGKDRAN